MATDTPAHGRSASLTAARHHVQTPPTRDRETLLRALYEQYEQQLQEQLAGFEPTMKEHLRPTPFAPPTPPPDLYQSVLLSPDSTDPQLSPVSQHSISSPFASHIHEQSFSQPLGSLIRRVTTTGAKLRTQPQQPQLHSHSHSHSRHRRSHSLPSSDQLPPLPLRLESASAPALPRTTGDADPMPSVASSSRLPAHAGALAAAVLTAAAPSATAVSSTRAYWCTCCGKKYAHKADWARHDEACRDQRSYMRHESCQEIRQETHQESSHQNRSRHEHSQSYSYSQPQSRGRSQSHARCESYGWNDNRVRQTSHARTGSHAPTGSHAHTSSQVRNVSLGGGERRPRRHPQRAWACGFCAAFLGSLERYQDHVALHFEGGKTLAHWHYANIIYGLLHQPAVHAAWKCIWTSRTASLPPHLRTKVSWPPEVSEKATSSTTPPRPTLQDALEHFDPLRQSATLLASRADALAIFVTVPVDDEPAVGDGSASGSGIVSGSASAATASPAIPTSKSLATMPGLGLPMSMKPSGRGIARKSLPHFPQARQQQSNTTRRPPPPLALGPGHGRTDSVGADSTGSSMAASSTASSSSLGFGYTTGLHHHRRAATSPTNFARPRPVRLLYPPENNSAIIPGLRLRPRQTQTAAIPTATHASPSDEGRFPPTMGDDAGLLSPEYARYLA